MESLSSLSPSRAQRDGIAPTAIGGRGRRAPWLEAGGLVHAPRRRLGSVGPALLDGTVWMQCMVHLRFASLALVIVAYMMHLLVIYTIYIQSMGYS